MLINNPINAFNVNENREVSLKSYLLRKYIPINILEASRVRIKGEGVYYTTEFDRTKSIFVHIPKAAGTSISKALYGSRQGHHTALSYRKANSSKFSSYYKFTIVRNPWDRLASTYFYLLNSPHEEDYLWAERNISKYGDFEAFVSRWLSKESVWEWKHLLPQSFFITDTESNMIVDNIFKMESIESGFQQIIKHIEPLSVLSHSNKIERQPYKELYNTKLIDKVAMIYEEDVSKFNYKY
ncbi:sulfotransferase family 2 domain-containing protein [Vibrio cyclitrophicus]